ncbi:hypothetical protein LCGC14_0589140 [marine sediment metagenome]|uniref:Uncharacterized protein n=1 Tax=marine sediment metagenome TaxID=412755 RepID=A0A0F9RXY3_9ZZZZ
MQFSLSNAILLLGFLTVMGLSISYAINLQQYGQDVKNNQELYKIYDYSFEGYLLFQSIMQSNFTYTILPSGLIDTEQSKTYTNYQDFQVDKMEGNMIAYKHMTDYSIPKLDRISINVQLIMLTIIIMSIVYIVELKAKLRATK